VLLVHAYLDGELDPANALGITQRMDTVPELAAEAERIKALQQLIRERLRLDCALASKHQSAACGGSARGRRGARSRHRSH
jgi:anti-sigma factor RsiW